MNADNQSGRERWPRWLRRGAMEIVATTLIATRITHTADIGSELQGVLPLRPGDVIKHIMCGRLCIVTVSEALIEAGRQDLIGNGCDCLIPSQPPKEAIEARRRRANDPDHYHTVANPAKGEVPGERGAGPIKPKGYRPGRKMARRQDKKPKGKGGTLRP